MNMEVLYFSSEQCCVCDVMRPKLQECVKEMAADAVWTDIDIETQKEMAAKHSVFISPVLLIMIDGKEYVRLARNFSIYQLKAKMERLLTLMNAP